MVHPGRMRVCIRVPRCRTRCNGRCGTGGAACALAARPRRGPGDAGSRVRPDSKGGFRGGDGARPRRARARRGRGAGEAQSGRASAVSRRIASKRRNGGRSSAERLATNPER